MMDLLDATPLGDLAMLIAVFASLALNAKKKAQEEMNEARP
jgi:hypothetical protein